MTSRKMYKRIVVVTIIIRHTLHIMCNTNLVSVLRRVFVLFPFPYAVRYLFVRCWYCTIYYILPYVLSPWAIMTLNRTDSESVRCVYTLKEKKVAPSTDDSKQPVSYRYKQGVFNLDSEKNQYCVIVSENHIFSIFFYVLFTVIGRKSDAEDVYFEYFSA